MKFLFGNYYFVIKKIWIKYFFNISISIAIVELHWNVHMECSQIILRNFKKMVVKNSVNSKIPILIKQIIKKIFGIHPTMVEHSGFHGDVIAKELVRVIIKKCNVTSFIETGTYHGFTTKYIASLDRGFPIFTCELNKNIYKNAKKNCRCIRC